MNNWKSQALAYAILPRILPRIQTLATSGFATVAYLLAVIYQSVGLLPADHIYLNPRNFGRYGIRHAIAAAGNRLILDYKHADQIFIFFTILAGLILLMLQLGLAIVAMIAQQPAVAMTVTDLFQLASPYNAGPSQDLTFIILDRVFGTKGIFDSCISTSAECLDMAGNILPKPNPYPQGFHLGLHMLLRFYSMGVFLIGVMIILYFITALVAETTTTGSPFGKRANKTWVPIRLIFFFALLLPLNTGGQNAGFNAGQIITFWIAKTGSNFATNAWGKFNQDLSNHHLIDAQKLVAMPNIPDIAPLVRFMFLAKTCKIAEEISYPYPNTGIQPYIVRSTDLLNDAAHEHNYLPLNSASYEEALQFSDYGNLAVVFGIQQTNFSNYKGNVKPICGEMSIPTIAVSPRHTAATQHTGASAIQELYFTTIQQMWTDSNMVPYAECVVRRNIIGDFQDPNCSEWPDADFVTERTSYYQDQLKQKIPQAIQQQIDNGDWNISHQILGKGWAGASLWYNRIAETNGQVTGAITNLPSVVLYPYVMEQIAYQRAQANENLTTDDIFSPELANSEPIDYLRIKDPDIARALYQAYTLWNAGNFDGSHITRKRSNIVIDAINLVFGTSGIFDMRKNANIHPLAQLSALGKGMMDASIRNLTIGTVGGGISKFMDGFLGQMAKISSSFLYNMGIITITISFILYYILPFLPFIYFFFAACGWVKSIFEAIVAIPLWSLAHILRIDGKGLPGPAASNGYYLLLEILIRPILILFGFVASILIFSAMVEVLNDIFSLVVANVSGFDLEAEAMTQQGSGSYESLHDYIRSPIDTFFFTVVYVIFVYISGLTCFKLIDLIPNKILRFMGVGVETLTETDSEEIAQGLLQKSFKGGTLATSNLQGGALAALIG